MSEVVCWRTLATIVCLAAAGACDPGPDDDLFAGCRRQSGTICTVAGTGVAADGADGLWPSQTRLYLPTDIAFSPTGALHIVDWNNHRIRAVVPGGRLKIVAGEGELSDGLRSDEVGGRLNHPTDVTFDRQGRLVIAAWHNSRIKRLDPATGQLEDIAGTGARAFGGDGGPARDAVLDLPVSVVFDEADNLYVSDQANQRIRCIDPAGIIRTVAGSGERGFFGDGGPPLDATFNLPVGQMGHPAAHITRDGQGNLYLADTLNHRVRKIDLGADTIRTVAGNGQRGAGGDGGPANEASLSGPVDVAIGPDGALYIADTDNDCIRRVHDGIITTVAGRCGACDPSAGLYCHCPSATDSACLGDGGPATQARLHRPFGIAFDPEGNLFIADSLHHRIRVVFR
jgi:sugar lactone lactonase YvrE